MQKRIVLHIILSICFLLFVEMVNGQNSYLSYGGYENIFSTQVDPTYQPDIKLMFGFPVISGVQIGASSSIRPEDFMEPLGTTKEVSFDRLLNNLRPNNRVGLDNSINLLYVGFQAHKNAYLSFGIDHEATMYGNFSKEFLEYFGRGNAAFLNEEVLFNKEQLYFNQHFSYHVGYNIRLDKLVLGTRFRVVQGINHFELTNWEARLFTDENSVPAYATTASVQFQALAGGGIAIATDSVRRENFEIRDAIASELGFAFDFGAAYHLNDNWRFSLSGKNIAGWITWPEEYGQEISLVGDGEIDFDGFETSLADEETDFDTELEELENELEESFETENTPKEIRTTLPSTYLATATYTHKKHSGTLLYALQQTNIQALHQMALIYHFSAAKWVQLDGALSYSTLYGTDLGLGCTLRGGPLQFNLGVDGIFGLTGGENIRKASVRFGLAFIFGKAEWTSKAKEKEKNPIPNKYF
jgi:hypothetical protein